MALVSTRGKLIREERGYSLVELLVVMAILSVVVGALTTLFVRATNAQADLNNRFQAQQTARVALDKIRRETHCGSAAAASGTPATIAGVAYYPTVTVTVSGCASGNFTWCTAAVNGSTTRFALYRYATLPATCGSTAGGIQWADFLQRGTVFALPTPATGSKSSLTIDLPVNVKPSSSFEAYELVGNIFLRNSPRA
jgi:prepilin-type N-terminal cleavage/methylation domain-containing protein